MSSILPVVGAVGGFIVGGPVGASIGSAIGGALAGSFGGNKVKLPTVEGPRLTDLRVQTSSYGEFIPEIFGSARISGNVIWSTDIKEVKVTKTTSSSQGGGKGGGGKSTQTQISYEYFATLAIGICKGPIEEITRVYADSKILDSNFLSSAQGKYNTYMGTESQMPDPIIEANMGVGNVPAYRGLAYVVIEDLPLASFGNRIPNFTFEVKRNEKFENSVEDKITDLVLIPGAGEFVYDTEKHTKQDGQYLGSRFIPSGDKTSLNMHNFDDVANVQVAVEQMLSTFPNLEYIALVVAWFGTSTDAGACEITPKVEYKTATQVLPYDWSVGGYNRFNAHAVLVDDDGNLTYGGTPSDKSVLNLCEYLKSKGLKVMLYPMLFIDQLTPTPKPWRGRITPQNLADCNSFFTKTRGFNNFILHYANLSVDGKSLKDFLDAFVIGSEMVGMTSYSDSEGSFPAVAKFKALASPVKAAVGSSVKVTYAADWSEYHSTNGWFNMDELWASSDIDFIGIDAYYPITPDLPQSQITEEKIKEYWEKGEGWDYYYLDSENRTGKTNFSDAEYAWKNLQYWWENTHTNPDDNITAWNAKMKPVWFTEFGFPSVDGCANQPNVFYDPNSSESSYPRESKGRIDYKSQREALNATIDYLEERKQQSGLSDLVPRKFVWTWDARPYPFWPDLKDIWADYQLWQFGHWVNGKIGNSTLGAVVEVLLKKVNISPSEYDVSELSDDIDGFLLTKIITVREALEQLQSVYFFDCVESDNKLIFKKRGGEISITIDREKLVPLSEDKKSEITEITRKQEYDLPQQISITYISRTSNYDVATQTSQRQTVKAVDRAGTNLPISLSDVQAKQVADITLYNSWVQREVRRFILPAEYCYLEPTDIINLSIDGVLSTVRINTIKIEKNGLCEVEAVAEDISTYDFYLPPASNENISEAGNILPETDIEFLDLPALINDNEDIALLRLALIPQTSNWAGASIFRSDDGGVSGGNNFDNIASSDVFAISGQATTFLEYGSPNTFDNANIVDIQLLHGELSNSTKIGVLNGANAAILGNEIIQFQKAELIGEKLYRLSNLLRGRLGTEHEISNHEIGERFIILNSDLLKIIVQDSLIGLNRHYKAVSVGNILSKTDEEEFLYQGNTLKPYSPVHIKGNKSGNDFIITWVRRTRIGGAWRDNIDIPLSEESEKYHIEILNGSNVVRTEIDITSPTYNYTKAKQIEDFGSVQNSISLRIYQISARVGRGHKAEATLIV